MILFESSFPDALIEAVWNKATIVMGEDPNIYRKDANGAWIRRDLYGKTGSKISLGWEIDHIFPVSLGGTDDVDNLQPLQWYNNRTKGNDFPSWNYKVTAA